MYENCRNNKYFLIYLDTEVRNNDSITKIWLCKVMSEKRGWQVTKSPPLNPPLVNQKSPFYNDCWVSCRTSFSDVASRIDFVQKEFTEKYLCHSLIFIKLQIYSLQMYQERDSSTGARWEHCFYKRPLADCFYNWDMKL